VSPLIAIVGETASGKSALAMQIAEQFHGELICADSWTVYRGFDIGTAKPSVEDQSKVPHHLLDVAGPVEGFSAAVFQRLAKQAIAEITSRGNLPILVGGTGLYIDSILYDYSFLPKSDPETRLELDVLTLDELVERVQSLGLNTDDIDMRNKRRIVRLIENEGMRPTKRSIRDNTCVLGMQVPRETLDARIAQRVDAMFARGLEDEVQGLAQTYGWQAEAMKGIGYREWQEYFTGTQTLQETRDKIIKSTMDLAKKQRTWFKRNNSIQWVSDRSNGVELITTFLNKTD
jgi:tRNA dimethylallyltransferase